MSKKRLILLLDGTWNDADFGTHDTNIVRLRELIAASPIPISHSQNIGLARMTLP